MHMAEGFSNRRMCSVVSIIWHQYRPWVGWRDVDLPSLGAVEERTARSKTSISQVKFCQGMN